MKEETIADLANHLIEELTSSLDLGSQCNHLQSSPQATIHALGV